MVLGVKKKRKLTPHKSKSKIILLEAKKTRIDRFD
jgi:hypothetical protein